MTTTIAGGRAARRQTMRRIRPRRSPAVPLLLAVWAGAAGVLWLWWHNTPRRRADTIQDLALWDELALIAKERGARLMYAVNSPEGERPDISAENLQRKIADIDRHDVFMCGPPGFAQSVYEALRGAGVPARRIHHESFEM